MSKYAPLSAYLRAQLTDTVTLSFGQIDQLVGGLPPSARNHEAWWGNSRTEDSHIWAHLWLAAGWERGSLDLSRELVVFERVAAGPAVGRHYWWVNHKQTYKAELEGGYIWSPKENQNGARNQTYINLTLVSPGDFVISYAGAEVRAIGVATTSSQERPKPEAFGQVGENWSNTGWLVPVEWTVLESPISPKDHLAEITSRLPAKHSPLQPNGNGNQGCYLASVSVELGEFILKLAAGSGAIVVERRRELEDQLKANEAERSIQQDESLTPTEREQLVRSRVGQGRFRLRVQEIERACRLTGVADERFLIASHIKPWKDCTNAERLDGHNGLMLAPHVDKLFDRGWISFSDSGELLVAGNAPVGVIGAWGFSAGLDVGTFSAKQRAYLQHHRKETFRGSV